MEANHISPTAYKIKAEVPGLAYHAYHVLYYLQTFVLLLFCCFSS